MLKFDGVKTSEFVAVVDIGSGSVGVALVELSRGTVPSILFSIRQDLGIQKKFNPKSLLFSTITSLSAVIKEMQKTIIIRPKEIHIFLSPHLLISQTRIIKAQYGDNVPITSSLISNLLKNERDVYLNDIHSMGQDESKRIPIEERVIKITLNGYEVQNAGGKYAKDLELSVYYSFSSQEIIESIKHTVEHSVNDPIIIFHSFAFSYFNGLRDSLNSINDFIACDIGSEITDFYLIKDGVLEQSVSFPIGKSYLYRSLHFNTETSDQLFSSELQLLNQGKLNLTTGGKLARHFHDAGGVWKEEVKKIIQNLAKTTTIPETLFLLSDDDVAPIFYELMSKSEFSKYSSLNIQPSIKTLSSADFANFCDNKSAYVCDPFIMISAIFLNKIFNS